MHWCAGSLEGMGLGPCLLLALHSYFTLHTAASVCWAAHWAAETQARLTASWRVGFSSPELFSVTLMGVRGVCRGVGGCRAGLGEVGLSLLPGQLCCVADVARPLFWCLCCWRGAELVLGDISTSGCHSSLPPWLARALRQSDFLTWKKKSKTFWQFKSPEQRQFPNLRFQSFFSSLWKLMWLNFHNSLRLCDCDLIAPNLGQ